MKRLSFPLITLSVVLCSAHALAATGDRASQTSTDGTAAVRPRAMQGGVVIAAGSHVFEVVPYEDGHVEAYPVGKEERANPTHYALRVTLTGLKKVIPVQLQYNVAQQRYFGTPPQPQKTISGPVILEATRAGATHRGNVAMVNPLTNPELGHSSKQMIAGPYAIEVSQGDSGKFTAIIRDAQNRPVSSKQVTAVANVHPVAKGKPPENEISVPLRPAADKSRFEFDLPENVTAFNWIGINVKPVRKSARRDEGVYSGSTRW